MICINDFHFGERVRIYPGCDHIFHLKCSQLWLEIEGTCPVCFNTPKDLPLSNDQIYQSLNPMNDQLVIMADFFGAANNLNQNSPAQMQFNAREQPDRRDTEESEEGDRNRRNNELREPLINNNNNNQ